MDFYKEYFVAIASILLFASCSTKRFAEHGLVDQNKQPVQLVLVSLKDTVFDHTHYDSVFKVSLINTGRKPFRLREPSVTHNSHQFRRICNPPASNISICNARKKACSIG
jgi:hypothetical protein